MNKSTGVSAWTRLSAIFSASDGAPGVFPGFPDAANALDEISPPTSEQPLTGLAQLLGCAKERWALRRRCSLARHRTKMRSTSEQRLSVVGWKW